MDQPRSDHADSGRGNERFVTYAELERRYGKTRATIWRWVKAGRLPAPYQLGPNSVGFALSEIVASEAALKRATGGQGIAA